MNMVTRSQWGAAPPTATTPLVSARGTGIHWEGDHLGSVGHADCASRVRTIQSNHMAGRNSDKKPWNDIAYSYLVCEHGYAFEGRGLGVRSAANGSTNANMYWYAICYLGGPGDPFTNDAKKSIVDLINYLKAHGMGNEIWPHSHFFQTQCPGDEIRGWLNSGFQIQGPVLQVTGGEFKNVDLGFKTFSNVTLDDNGCGWLPTDIPDNKILSFKPQASYPPAEGYWPIPEIGSQAHAVNASEASVIEIRGGGPHQVVSFTVWYIK